ncbi:MAG: starch-binding protein [Ruminococcus sp.]|nr:starch-binding protein [Ruminococcus sp.]
MKIKFLKLSSFVLILFILVSSFSVCFNTTASAEETLLPDFVDNSLSPYFPAIGNQEDLGSCVSWGQTYYQFTYMMNRSMGVPTTPDNTFSPSFNFNIINGGRGTGAWDIDGYNSMKEIGSVPLSTVPYNTKEWNNWFATEQVWKEAMQYRIKDYTYLKDIGMESSAITSPDDADLQNIKTLLAQGEVLAVTTPIYSWDVERIKAHPDVSENDKYVDEYIVRLCDKSGQGHRLALVGYNDNIWTDVNDNGNVDSGEMGAFKVANSWGTERHNKGFMWIAYDALNMTSCVKDCPVSGNYRPEALHDFVSIEVIPYDSDSDLYLRYTLNTADRSQGKVYVTATKNGNEYSYEVGVKRQHGMTFNKYSYDGTTNPNDGTMLYALSNIVPDVTSETLHEYAWSIKFEDTNADGKVFTVKNMEIVDEFTGGVSKPSNTYPIRLDGSSQTVNFPQFEEYVPVTTTVAPETTEKETLTTVQPVITEPVENTTVPASETEPPKTTVIPTESAETTAEVIPTTVVLPTETTIIFTENTTLTTEPVETTTEAVVTTLPEVEEYVYGDANGDGNIKINDASVIQKFIAFLVKEDALNLTSADCNIDTKISVKDATCIQKYLAKLTGFANVGEKYTVVVTHPTDYTEIATIPETPTPTPTPTAIFDTEAAEQTTETSIITEPSEVVTTIANQTESSIAIYTESAETTETTAAVIITTATQEITTEATEPATEAPIEPSTPSVTEPAVKNVVTFTNSFGWQGTISCYYWSDSSQSMSKWPGVPMQNSGQNEFGETLYTLDLPEDASYVIFTNGNIQTIDIPYTGGEQKFYPVAPDSGGKYTVKNW